MQSTFQKFPVFIIKYMSTIKLICLYIKLKNFTWSRNSDYKYESPIVKSFRSTYFYMNSCNHDPGLGITWGKFYADKLIFMDGLRFLNDNRSVDDEIFIDYQISSKNEPRFMIIFYVCICCFRFRYVDDVILRWFKVYQWQMVYGRSRIY